jgi:hypothetical protein
MDEVDCFKSLVTTRDYILSLFRRPKKKQLQGNLRRILFSGVPKYHYRAGIGVIPDVVVNRTVTG